MLNNVGLICFPPPLPCTCPVPADASERALAQELRGIGVGVQEVPEWKQQVGGWLLGGGVAGCLVTGC